MRRINWNGQYCGLSLLVVSGKGKEGASCVIIELSG